MIALLIKAMAVYFLFIVIFGDKKDKPHSVIVFLSCFIAAVFPLSPSIDEFTYIEKRNLYVLYDGVTALMLTMVMSKDNSSWKHAGLLAFATLCHTMIILSLKNSHAGFFYTWYNELIIAVGLLQMMVSYDGLTGAFSNLQNLLLRTYTYRNRNIQNLSAYKNGRKKS